MNYTYTAKQGQPLNIWQMRELEETVFESPVATFDHEDRFRIIATEAIDMKTIAEIVYPVRQAFLKEDFITDAPYETEGFSKLYFPWANRKVDFSDFSHDPKVLSNYVRCYVNCNEDVLVDFEVKTCGGIKLWLNGQENLLYKSYERNVPNSKEFSLDLKKGLNEFLIYTNDLAERDVFFYFELINKSNIELNISVPIEQEEEKINIAKEVMESIYLEKDTFIAEEIILRYDNTLLEEDMIIYCGDQEMEVRLSAKEDKVVIGDAGNMNDPYFSKTESKYFPIKTDVDGLLIETRLYLVTYNTKLAKIKGLDSIQDRKLQALKIAADEAKKDEIGTALALLATEGKCSDLCCEIIEIHLERIESRLDCADFRLSVILLIVKNYGELLSKELKARIKNAALNFRYWCDEPGNDVMWFFSENHALLFHVAQYLTGVLYPNEVFVSGLTSEEQRQLGYDRISRWFNEFLPKGYDEWNSLTYLPVDCIAFFTLHEVAPDMEIRKFAKEGLDYTFEIIASNMHHKVFASSYGRTYEHTLKGLELGELAMYAWISWNQGTVNVRNHAASLFAVSSYEPDDYKSLRDLSEGRSLTIENIQGCHNTLTYIHKRSEYSLASTMNFSTFETGLQQHFVNLSFSQEEIPIWLNHPGELVFSGQNRPSYWGGWQTIPYVEQYKNIVMVGIKMKDSDEVDFVHFSIPLNELDSYEKVGSWFVFSKGNAYGAFWFANDYELTRYGANTDKEIISRGRQNAIIIKCASKDEYGTFDTFVKKVTESKVVYESPEKFSFVDHQYGELVATYGEGLYMDGQLVQRNKREK